MKRDLDHERNLVDSQVKPVATFHLIIGVAIAVIGASFQYGYNIAVVNAPADEVKDFFYPFPENLSACVENTTGKSNDSIPPNDGICKDKPVATFHLIIGVAIAVIGASFQYGYNIAVVNAPADEVKDFFYPFPENLSACVENTTGKSNDSIPPNNDDICKDKASYKKFRDNIYAIPVSAFAAAGMVGSLLVGPVVKRFGRLGGLMVNNVISVIAAIFLGVTKPANSYALLIIGRIIIGVFAGLATGVVPMYIGEISPKEWRGAIGVLNQLLITIGILVAQVFGLSQLMGTPDLWPYLFAFTAVPSLISCICYPLMLKSPRFLLIDRGREDAARNVLVQLRGSDNVQAEMDEMRKEAEEQAAAGQMTIPQLFRDRTVRWQLITILLMMAAQQLSGINAVFFYSNMIFEKAGFKDSDAQNFASVGVGAFNVLMTVVSVVIIERMGRKKLIVYGFGFMIIWCLLLTILLNLLQKQTGNESSWISYACAVCLFGYIFGFAIGPGPIPWLITAELFRQSARPPAFMVACCLNWACNFIVGISFPAVAFRYRFYNHYVHVTYDILSITGPYVFLLFMCVCIGITIYLQIVLPETKNKTFQEIAELFAKRNKVGMDKSKQDAAVPLQDMNKSFEKPDRQLLVGEEEPTSGNLSNI